jgi:glycosyltransferase involved in cell wall biosynthesis
VSESPRRSVDVVIPMRNGRSTIFAALASVLNQTRHPQSIFVVDDGSTDGGGSLVRARRLPTVVVIETPPRGVSHARNTGIAASRADFIAFLDCDDLWAPDKLERQLEVFDARPDVAVVSCGSISFDMRHHPIAGTTYYPTLRGYVFKDILKQGFIRGGLSSNVLIRRSALLEIGCFDEMLAFGEDVDLWLRLARNYVFDYCPAPLAYIVENAASVSRRPATPASREEALVQTLSCLEKWLDDRAAIRWIPIFAARLILTHAVGHRLTIQGLATLRKAIVSRAPALGLRIARTRLHLMAALAVAGVVYSPSLYSAWRVRRRRLLSSKQ